MYVADFCDKHATLAAVLSVMRATVDRQERCATSNLYRANWRLKIRIIMHAMHHRASIKWELVAIRGEGTCHPAPAAAKLLRPGPPCLALFGRGFAAGATEQLPRWSASAFSPMRW